MNSNKFYFWAIFKKGVNNPRAQTVMKEVNIRKLVTPISVIFQINLALVKYFFNLLVYFFLVPGGTFFGG